MLTNDIVSFEQLGPEVESHETLQEADTHPAILIKTITR